MNKMEVSFPVKGSLPFLILMCQTQMVCYQFATTANLLSEVKCLLSLHLQNENCEALYSFYF